MTSQNSYGKQTTTSTLEPQEGHRKDGWTAGILTHERTQSVRLEGSIIISLT